MIYIDSLVGIAVIKYVHLEKCNVSCNFEMLFQKRFYSGLQDIPTEIWFIHHIDLKHQNINFILFITDANQYRADGMQFLKLFIFYDNLERVWF